MCTELLYLQRWQKMENCKLQDPHRELLSDSGVTMPDGMTVIIYFTIFAIGALWLQHALCNSHQCTSTTKLIASGARQIANPQRLQPCSMVDAMYQLQPMKPTSMMKAPQALTCAPLLLPLAQHLMHDTR